MADARQTVAFGAEPKKAKCAENEWPLGNINIFLFAHDRAFGKSSEQALTIESP
jgi:hypothetical protein